MLIFCSHLESEPVGQYQPVQYMRIISGDFSTGSVRICILRNGLIDKVSRFLTPRNPSVCEVKVLIIKQLVSMKDARTSRKCTGAEYRRWWAWSFRPPAFNAVKGMSVVCGFVGGKVPWIRNELVHFPKGTA